MRERSDAVLAGRLRREWTVKESIPVRDGESKK